MPAPQRCPTEAPPAPSPTLGTPVLIGQHPGGPPAQGCGVRVTSVSSPAPRGPCVPSVAGPAVGVGGLPSTGRGDVGNRPVGMEATETLRPEHKAHESGLNSRTRQLGARPARSWVPEGPGFPGLPWTSPGYPGVDGRARGQVASEASAPAPTQSCPLPLLLTSGRPSPHTPGPMSHHRCGLQLSWPSGSQPLSSQPASPEPLPRHLNVCGSTPSFPARAPVPIGPHRSPSAQPPACPEQGRPRLWDRHGPAQGHPSPHRPTTPRRMRCQEQQL